VAYFFAHPICCKYAIYRGLRHNAESKVGVVRGSETYDKCSACHFRYLTVVMCYVIASRQINLVVSHQKPPLLCGLTVPNCRKIWIKIQPLC